MRNINKFFYLFIFSFSLIKTGSIDHIEAHIEFDSEKSAKIPVLIVKISTDQDLEKIVKKVQKNISMGGQFEVKTSSDKFPNKKTDLKKFSDMGFYLVVFIGQSFDEKLNKSFIEFRIYDSASCQMLKGTKIEKTDQIANIVSNCIWKELTGDAGIFGTKIAYVKRVSNSKNKHKSVICISDFDGDNETKIIKTATINIKPQFVKTGNICKIFYSEFTAGNVRLMSVFTDGSHKRPVFDFDGTIVGISCSKNNNEAVYCRSGDIWSYKYDSELKKSIHTKIINDFGNSSCPNLLDSGDIIFASDFSGKNSNIYIYKKSLGNPEKLNISGYCVAPVWCCANNKIAYSKRVDSNMQLFIYDLNNYQEEQITFGAGNKIDPCWSPCGNYLLFCYQQNSISRIACCNILVKDMLFLTPTSEFCSYPACPS